MCIRINGRDRLSDDGSESDREPVVLEEGETLVSRRHVKGPRTSSKAARSTATSCPVGNPPRTSTEASAPSPGPSRRRVFEPRPLTEVDKTPHTRRVVAEHRLDPFEGDALLGHGAVAPTFTTEGA